MNIKYFEVQCGDDDSPNLYHMVIKATRKPSVDEAQKFCQSDIDLLHLDNVTGVYDLEDWEVEKFFDCSKKDKWPVFS